MLPIGLMLVDNALEHGLEDSVDSFNLPIRLWVIGCGEFMPEANEERKLLEEVVLKMLVIV